MKKDKRACPQCGGAIPAGAHLCKHCDKRFNHAQEKDTSASDQPRPMITKGELGWFVAFVGAAIIFSHILPRNISTSPPIAERDSRPYADISKQETWIAASQISIRKRLKDPGSAKFRDVHFYSGGKAAVTCGEVTAKNSFGGYSGYERFVAAGPTDLIFLESDLSSRAEMDKVWKEMCVKAPTDKA